MLNTVTTEHTSDKIKLNFLRITERLKQLDFPDFDAVVGIGTGGVVPAVLVAQMVNRPLHVIEINYRNPDNLPKYDAPRLLGIPNVPQDYNCILLVDDVCVTGKTLNTAKTLLSDRTVHTFVLKGDAEIVAFPEITSCVHWPWKVE